MRRAALVLGVFCLCGRVWAGDWQKDIAKAAKLHQHGNLKGAENVLLDTLLQAETFPESDPRLAYTLDYLGTLNLQMKEPDKAIPMFERAVKAFAASRGPSAEETLQAKERLAESYDERNLYAKSEPLYWTLVDAKRGDALLQSADLNSLAVSLDAQGKLDQALIIYQRALDMREDHLGSDAPELPEILNNMGRVHYIKGDYAGAKPYYERAIKIDEANLQAGDPQLADDSRRLSALCKKTGLESEAKAWEDKAVSVDRALPSKAPKKKDS